MKSYTDIEQSKKLAEILSLESADGFYAANVIITEPFITYLNGERNIPGYKGAIPCWSLAALLRELPDTMLGKDKDGYVVMVETMGSGLTTFASNPVDACYEMVLKLKEKNLL